MTQQLESISTWITASKVVRTVSFTTRDNGDWTNMKRRWNPMSLEDNSLLSLIDMCHRIFDLDALEIPTFLKEKAYRLYLDRKLQIKKCHTPTSLDMTFDTVFERVSADERVTIHYFFDVLPFAYETTIIVYNWYSLDDDPKRLCPYCWHKMDSSEYKELIHWTSSDVVTADALADELWSGTAWCEQCKLTALFRLEDFYDTNHHPVTNYRFIRAVQRIAL